MNKKEERALAQVRVKPSVREALKVLAAKKKMSMADLVEVLVYKSK